VPKYARKAAGGEGRAGADGRLRYTAAVDLRGRRASIALLAATVVAFATLIGFSIAATSPEDATVYYLAAQAARDGPSPYTISRADWDRRAAAAGMTNYQWPYRYPPLTAELFLPLTALGWAMALIVFETISAIAFIGGALLVGRALGGGRHTAAALGALLLCGPAWLTLSSGQINGLLYLFVALAFWGLCRRRVWALALGLAAGTALKVLPGALVVWLLWTRRWRAALYSLGFLAVILFVPLASADGRAFLDYPRRAYALTEPARVQNSPGIDTFTAVIGRLTMSWPGTSAPGAVGHVRLAATLLTLTLAAATATLVWPRRGPAGVDDPATAGGDARLEFALVLAASLIVGPFTFYHQFVLLLIPLQLVAERLWRERRRKRLTLLIAVFVFVDAQQVAWMTGRRFLLDSGVWRTLNGPFVLTLVLWTFCALFIRCDKWRSPVVAREARLAPRPSAP
jgi:hypothetical protein